MVNLQLVIFGILISIFSRNALSQEGDAAANGIPDPRAWASELPDSFWSTTPGILRNFTIVTKDAAQEKKWQKATAKVPSLGFLQFVPTQTLGFFRALNASEDGTLMADDPGLASVPVQLYLKDEGKITAQAMVKGQLKTLNKWGMKKGDRAGGEQFYRWLAGKLNYDAVVLDQKDSFILAAMVLSRSELGQGLLLKNSASKLVLKEGKLQGEALLQMLRVEGEFVVLESLLASGAPSKITPGSKILLGQSEKLKQMLVPAGASPAPVKAPAGAAPPAEEGAAPQAD